jgi:hypothetical protein
MAPAAGDAAKLIQLDPTNPTTQFKIAPVTVDAAGTLTAAASLVATGGVVAAGAPANRGVLQAYAYGGSVITEIITNINQVITAKPVWAIRLDAGAAADAIQFFRTGPSGGAQTLTHWFNPSGQVMLPTNGGGMRCANVGSVGAEGVSNSIAFGWNGAVQCRVDTTQQGSVNITPPSDERLKIEVREDCPGLDTVLALRPVTFEYDQNKSDIGFPEGRRYGLIAQEAREHVPTVIEETGGYLALDYRMLVPVLIQAIKELYARTNEKA